MIICIARIVGFVNLLLQNFLPSKEICEKAKVVIEKLMDEIIPKLEEKDKALSEKESIKQILDIFG